MLGIVLRPGLLQQTLVMSADAVRLVDRELLLDRKVKRQVQERVHFAACGRIIAIEVPIRLIEDGMVFGMQANHLHGDSFEIPAGATRVAGSDACANQAFVYGERVAALQFHLETTREGAAALVTHCGDDLAPGPFVQTAEEILRDHGRFTGIHRAMAALLERMEAAP